MSARIGNFSSSEIYKLLPPKRGNANFLFSGQTYILEKSYERKLGKALTMDIPAKPTAWGNAMEEHVFDCIKTQEHKLLSSMHKTHNSIDSWVGAADYIAGDVVGDIKCPYTLKSFCELSEMKTGEDLKENKPEYYYQLVSNAILNDMDKAELTVWVPYESEILEMHERLVDYCATNNIGIRYSANELPSIRLTGVYHSIHTIRFDVPGEDKQLLETQVKKAVEKLKELCY